MYIDTMAVSKELVAASAAPLVLSMLAQGESYGYEIIQRVRELSGGRLDWTDGMLYPVLHRLERKGLTKAVWRGSESGRRRKYYRLTRKGKVELARQRDDWLTVHASLARLWGLDHV
jgi:DNA-binding PadR family transcriptional regulator